MKKVSKKFDLTILIPAYREEKRIGKTLDELAKYIKQETFFKSRSVEVVVVSADSPDKTHQLVLSKQKKFNNLTLLKPGPKVGKGRDVQYGMLRASGAAILFMDADMATPIWHLKKFYQTFENGADVVVATRNLKRHHSNFMRRAVSNLGNLAFRILGGVWIEDSQCGFKLFSRSAAQICFSKLTIMKWGFDMEVLTIAKVNNLKVVAHRINDWRNVPDGTFEGSIIINTLNSLQDLGHIFLNRVKQSYR